MSRGVVSCDGSGTSDLCLVKRRHNHCVCGLACGRRRSLCDLCRAERLVRVRSLDTIEAKRVNWDGRTYYSRRRRRITTSSPEAYLYLAWAMGGTSYVTGRRP